MYGKIDMKYRRGEEGVGRGWVNPIVLKEDLPRISSSHEKM